MRLYLSSYKLGNHPEKIKHLVGINKHVGIILNAGDFDSKTKRIFRVKKNIKYLKALGFTSEEIDLRKYFGKPNILKKKLLKFGLVWVKGGNIFLLQRAFEQSGFNIIIKELLNNDTLVYVGESAGSVIVGPSLNGLDIVDNPKNIPKGYSKKFSMRGLHLVNFMIAPHYKSNHPESSSVEKLIKYFKRKKIPYKPLKDGEVVVINKSNKKKIGFSKLL